MNKYSYCESLTEYKRWQSREVRIGSLLMGADNPVRLQSMSNVDPRDAQGNIEQAIRIIEAGGELVRFTAPSGRDAEVLKEISAGIRAAGYDTPLVADIHFNPGAAMVAARFVEKIRINPGNFAEPKDDKVNFSEKEYAEALAHIEQVFGKLVDYCKQHRRAMRIGSNHGSLSQRIMDRYGDTPLGMVEAAMEYLRMAVKMEYYDIVLSMKASNIRVMVQAYRLLVHKMMAEGMNFPIHLGVTEAGEGEDGRIKSAAGIGALLEDGIGDTIRVSLTEDPELEIPVARIIAGRYAARAQKHDIPPLTDYPINPFEYNKRPAREVAGIGGKNVPVVIGYDIEDIKLMSFAEFKRRKDLAEPLFVDFGLADMKGDWAVLLKQNPDVILVSRAETEHRMAEHRRIFVELIKRGIDCPVVIKNRYSGLTQEEFQIHAAADFGGLLVDGLGDGIWLEHDAAISHQFMVDTALGILQAARARITKTDFISCPSCGRTLFNIQEATARIRAKTSHLTGLKIGIMGCIVNGPGEMADADYGYVGAGSGKINLYKGKEVVRKGIPEADAVDELIELIREHGDWVEP
jgi:(E)-4-hydroxy-3-methylbut-2-enyl-diphosphate synthase